MPLKLPKWLYLDGEQLMCIVCNLANCLVKRLPATGFAVGVLSYAEEQPNGLQHRFAFKFILSN